MYAIAQIIYGLPLVANDGEESPRTFQEIEDAIENEEAGFLSYYSGAGDEMPAAFGLELGSFDEACAYTNISDLALSPSAQQQSEYDALLKGVSDTVRKRLESLGQPKVFFLWTTS